MSAAAHSVRDVNLLQLTCSAQAWQHVDRTMRGMGDKVAWVTKWHG